MNTSNAEALKGGLLFRKQGPNNWRSKKEALLAK